MKVHRNHFTCLLVGGLVFLFAITFAGSVRAGEMKLVIQLIWGTNDAKSPDPKHKAVDNKVAAKLKKLPFKWQYYYEVCSHDASVQTGKTHSQKLSKECEVKIQNLGDDNVEVQLFGKGELVSKISQKLTKGEFLVTGGNAANLTAWFVVLRQAD